MEDPNSLLSSENKSDTPIKNNTEENQIPRESTQSVAIHQPNYDYLEQIQITDYFFITHKNIPAIFYTFIMFTIVILICGIIYLKLKSIIIIIVFGLFFVLIGAFPYGIYVKLNKENKALVMEKKCMIPLFSRFISEEYSLFDIQEFVLLKKQINDEMSCLKIELMLMSGKSIILFNEWVLKEEENEFIEKTKRLNEFVNKNN
jgi:hypothetical protein